MTVDPGQNRNKQLVHCKGIPRSVTDERVATWMGARVNIADADDRSKSCKNVMNFSAATLHRSVDGETICPRPTPFRTLFTFTFNVKGTKVCRKL